MKSGRQDGSGQYVMPTLNNNEPSGSPKSSGDDYAARLRPVQCLAADSKGDSRAADALVVFRTVLPEIKLLIALCTAAIIVVALHFGRDILMPLALATLLGFILDPLVARLKRLGLSRTVAVIVVVTLTLSLIAGAGLVVGRQISSISAELSTYQSNIKHKVEELRRRAAGPGMFDGAVKTFGTIQAELDKTSANAEIKRNTQGSAVPVQRVQLEEKTTAPIQRVLSWLEAGGGTLANAGIVLVFVVIVLLDRVDLRDRLLRLWSGSLHRSTDAMDEAGVRITKYLTMQLLVNLTYGVPIAAGLWVIGVPGAILWGLVAAVMRFVPYIGAMISAVFPLALAFAVDPGWSMVLWTIGLILAMEMLSNNLIEPWLYGASTGLSTISLMVAATFWTALWGPVGLIMSTPLTVCLLVIGRHLPRLEFLDVLLGSQPALDVPTRIYQRLLAGDVEEAIELATAEVDGGTVADFYNKSGIAVLRMASSDHSNVATAEHRHRVVIGMDALLEDLSEQHPPPETQRRLAVVCIGGKWEVDTLAAKMVAHGLSFAGTPTEFRAAGPVNADYLARLDLRGAGAVCISYFSPDPTVQARHFCARLRRRWPDLKIVLALWNAPAALLGEDTARALQADAVVTSMNEAVICLSHLLGTNAAEIVPAPAPEKERERLTALRLSGALDARARPIFESMSRRAAEIFDVPMAMVSLLGEDRQLVPGVYGGLIATNGSPAEACAGGDQTLPRSWSACRHVVANGETLVVPDLDEDARFAGDPALPTGGLRFYAGAPLRDADKHVIGTLCILDTASRTLTQRDVKLLEALANDVIEALQSAVLQWGEVPPVIDVVRPHFAAVGSGIPAGAG